MDFLVQHLPLLRPPDGGQFYYETDLSRVIVEPWNAVSSLTFLIPAVYWVYVIGRDWRKHPFFFFCQCLLAIGGVGSALYHAFRISEVLMLLDVLPITALTMALGFNFWIKVLEKLSWAIWLNVIFFFVRSYFYFIDDSPNGINIAYFLSGLNIGIPLIVILIRTKGTGWVQLGLSLFFCAMALYFRYIDDERPAIFTIGTHWLWHVLCSFGAFYLSRYLYLTSVVNLLRADSLGKSLK